MLNLSEKQKDFLANSNHYFNISTGAVSSGKTFVQILRWIQYVAKEVPDDSLLLLTGKTTESLYDNFIRDLIKLDSNFIYKKDPPRVFYPRKNIEMACISAADSSSWKRVQGKSVAGWCADEIVTYPENFTLMCQSRVRAQGKQWKKFWSCNPDSPENYVLKKYIKNENIDVKTWHFILDDNPNLTEGYKNEIKASYSGVYYDRFVLGLWVLAEGMVYDEFDQKIHVIDPIDLPMNWKYYRSIDWGYQNPFCCLFAAYNYKDNILYIYDEHYKAKKLIEYHAEQIKKRDNRKIENKEERIYFDKTFADHDAQDNAEIKKYGIHTSNAVKGEVNSGIQRVKARLKVIDGKPKLYVFKNCENLIREFGLYRWNDKREGYNEKEEPVKAEDHALDPLRYLINYLDKGKLKVSKVSASSLGL